MRKINSCIKDKLRIIIQIYEIQDPDEAEKLVELGVDHVGSVILSNNKWKSKKIKDVVSICKEARKKSSIIFLFDNMDVMLRAIDYYEPDIIHFCEDITNGSERHLKRQIILKEKFPDLMIMRSIPIPPAGEKVLFPVKNIGLFEPYTDIFLIDTYMKNPPVEGYIGITGRVCNWEVAKKIVEISSKPVILGGGLNPNNVYEALSIVRPYGVDSCTGTNATDENGRPIRFKKDLDKVKKFIEECRRYERERVFG